MFIARRSMAFLRDLRDSLFFLPTAALVCGVVLAEVALIADARLDDIPDRLTATVESARAVLGVVAGATLTFAGIAFSVSLLLISRASSQYSPRVVTGLFSDPFNKRVIAIVIGAFTYTIVVMRAVRSETDDGIDAVVPSASVVLALALGLVSILAIVAFIDHAARNMEVSRILHRVTENAIVNIKRIRAAAGEAQDPGAEPDGEGHDVRFDDDGWVKSIDTDVILGAIPPGATVRLDYVAGRYAIAGVTMCTVWPAPDDPGRTDDAIRRAVVIGEARTLEQDVTYGVRQLADVALRALSPGINDPTTAQDAMFHLGSVLCELLKPPIDARLLDGPDGRTLLMRQAPTPEEIVGVAFDEVRIAAADTPTVQIYLLELLHLIRSSIDVGDGTRALERQAALIDQMASSSDLLPHDIARVRDAYAARFGESR